MEFINSILDLADIDDKATFTRSIMMNKTELIQVLLQASSMLDSDYVTTKILEYLGDGDKAEEILKKLDVGEMQRFAEEE